MKYKKLVKPVITKHIVNYNGVEITVNPNITIQEKHQFCDILFHAVYSSDENGEYAYRPYLVRPIEKALFFKMFTNVEIPNDELGDFVDKIDSSNIFSACVSDNEYIQTIFMNLFDDAEEYVERKYNEIIKSSTDYAIADFIDYATKILNNLNFEAMLEAVDKLSAINDASIINSDVNGANTDK